MTHVPLRHALGVRLLAVTVGAAAALAVLVPATADARDAAHAKPPACQSKQLVNWLNTVPNGALGTVYYELQFTNLGRPCTLRGYPGVSAVSLSGHQLGKPASRVKVGRIKTVTVKTNRSVHAAVGIVDAGAIPKSKCHPTWAAGLRVFAPNGTTAQVIPFPFQTCATGGSLRIQQVE